jgi:hypothetical protein
MTDPANADHDATPAALRLNDQLGLVERLRKPATAPNWATADRWMMEAADEIERLRARLMNCGGDNCMGRRCDAMTNWITEQAAEARVAAERERWRTLLVGPHLYEGDCPDGENWHSRDPDCPACAALGDWRA